jgi:hypothetical protein
MTIAHAVENNLLAHEWFSVLSMDQFDTPVFIWVSERQAIGIKRRTRYGYSWRVVVDRSKTQDLPEHSWPQLWRPINRDEYQGYVPEPAVILVPPKRPSKRVADAPEPSEEYSFHPYHVAGEITLREAEVRTIRGIWTEGILDPVYKSAQRRSSGDWPRDWVIAARCRHEQLASSRDNTLPFFRDVDYSDFYIDKSNLEARQAKFSPTRIDLNDYEKRVYRWRTPLAEREAKVVFWRASLPAYSWMQISEMLEVSRTRCQEIYSNAMKKVHAEANRK